VLSSVQKSYGEIEAIRDASFALNLARWERPESTRSIREELEVRIHLPPAESPQTIGSVVKTASSDRHWS
jgi:hypothetical protein